MRNQQASDSFERSKHPKRTCDADRALARLRALSGPTHHTVPAYELAQALGLTLGEVVPALDALAAQGLAERRPAGWAPKAGAA